MATTASMIVGSAVLTRAVTWSDGACLHFSLYESKGERTSGAQLSFAVDDLEQAHGAAIAAGATVLHEPGEEPWGTQRSVWRLRRQRRGAHAAERRLTLRAQPLARPLEGAHKSHNVAPYWYDCCIP